MRAMTVVGSTDKLNSAVRDCLSRCYFSSTPVLSLTEYLKRLMSSGDWTTAEVAYVRSAAIHILRNVAAPEEDDGLPIGFSLEYRP
jgi:hypothetical protein